MEEFKIGDKVKIIEACSENKVGDIVTLKRTSKDGDGDAGLWAGNCSCTHCWEKIEGEFEVGEKVKLVRGGKIGWESKEWWKNAGLVIGGIYEIEEAYNNSSISVKGYNHHSNHFEKTGDTMNKYEELKQRIEAVEGWGKEADDILEEINNPCTITIRCGDNKHIGQDGVTRHFISVAGSSDYFYYTSQCEKLQAFKDALMWLLDHSSIKKDEKRDKIKALEEQVEDIQRQVEELKVRQC